LAVNRAARIMSMAHGGQVLLSHAVAVLVGERLPGGVALRDLGRLRLRDLARPEHVYQVVHPLLRSEFPALRSLEVTPNNLPQQLTSFVGREHELAEVARLLAEKRLLTLQGTGGIGKTRLMLQAAAAGMDAFPDGVWLVELAALNDPRLVPQAVASVLHVKEDGGRPVIEALVKVVHDRRLLVILDNCEHLVQACAELAVALLRAGAHVQILASSREPLHVGGEAIFPVPPLPVPDAGVALKRQALQQFAATRLFLERALAVQPELPVSDEDAMAIAGICQRLDGIPLALELAAARVRGLSVAQIAARLSDCFRLLTGGGRTAVPRQQTLRALIDWSYDLLTEAERTLFRRLAVFAGGFALEAAEAVGAGGDAAASDVLSLLTNLVQKSLVAFDPGTGRYQMLETVRQYAQERLAHSGQADHARAGHVAFFAALADQARPNLVGPRQTEWLARIDAERENLLAALTWCEGTEEGAQAGLRLLDAIKHYWFNRGLLALGHRLAVEALARPGAQAHNLARCCALFDAGQFCCAMGRYAQAQPLLEESLTIAREIGDPARVAMTLQPLCETMAGLGRFPAARAYAEEALVLARELPNRRELAAALNALAQLHRVEGRLEAAEPLYTQVIALARELGDRESVAIGLLNLAMVAIGRETADRARPMLLETLAFAEQSGSKPVAQSVFEVCAGLAAAQGHWEQAARFYGVAEAHADATGLHRDPADEAFLAPYMAQARRALGVDQYAQAEAAGRALSYPKASKDVRAWLGAMA
jgi:predicted ATPase